MEAKGTVGIVVRVSDVKGRDKRGDRFISPEEQVRVATGYCEAAGYAVTVIEPKDMNVSHTTPLDERPGMGEALRLVEAGLLAGIAVASQDRIGTLAVLRHLKDRLHGAGAVLKVPDNPSAEVLDARGYMKLPAEYVSLMHEAQREEIGLRWAAAQANARGRGVLPQREPFGYERDETGRLAVSEPEADQVRQLFRRKAAGEAVTSIARALGWAHSTARQRLLNADYLGVPDLIPAIVTRADFDAAQAGRKTQARASGNTTAHLVLPGLARCAGCGRTLKALRRPRADGSFVQAYFCKNAHKGGDCAARAYVHADELEGYVLARFERELRATPRHLDAVEAAHGLEQAEAELHEAEAELRAFLELASALERTAFLTAATARQERVEAARARVAEFSAKLTRLPAGGRLASYWDKLETVEERRLVLRGFLDRVEVARGASHDLQAHVQIFWADGSVLVASDERDARITAA
jgi:DNA invertase Pin-like site-specific DNA recombinase